MLTPADVPEMMELVERTQPGPFLRRTIELGTYLGIRDGDALVATAGTRMHLPGFTEISAVCTDDEHRGVGSRSSWSATSTRSSNGVRSVPSRGPHEHTGDPVYEPLGFTTRREIDFAARSQ